MLIQASNLTDWGLRRTGSATATVKDNSFVYSASASTVSTLERLVYLDAGQTVKFSMMHNTTWSRPRVQITRNSDGLLCNYIDLDYMGGFQEINLQYTMPIMMSGYVTITFGSVDGLNAAGAATNISIDVDTVKTPRVIAFCDIVVTNGTAVIDSKYNNFGVKEVSAAGIGITVQLNEDWDQSQAGFSRPTCFMSRRAGGSIHSGVIEYIHSYTQGGVININAIALVQDSETKDISYGYRDFSSDTFSISLSVIRD